MGGTTPKYGLPYPSGTDRLMDGDNAIQALAEKVELVLGNSGAAWTNYTPTYQGFTGTTNLARYFQMGKLIVVAVHATVSAVTSNMIVSLPKPIDGTTGAMQWQIPIGCAIACPDGSTQTFGGVWPGHALNLARLGTPSWSVGSPGAWGGGTVGLLAVYETSSAAAKPGEEADPDRADNELPGPEESEGTND